MNITKHVVPLNDEQEHLLFGAECPCNPARQSYPDGDVIVHNSFDQREIIEQAETMPGIQPTREGSPRWAVVEE